jgi:hypothetical protein
VPNTTPSVLNLSLTEIFQNGGATGSTTSSVISVGWQNGNTAVGAQIQVQAGGGDWNNLGNIAGTGCTFIGAIGVTYTVKATAYDWAGNLLGSPVTASITVVASSNAPGNVTNFKAAISVSASTTTLTWTEVAGADHYEIRYTEAAVLAWSSAEVLWDGTGATWTDSTIRNGTYLICAVGPLTGGSVMSLEPAYVSDPGANGSVNMWGDLTLQPGAVATPVAGTSATLGPWSMSWTCNIKSTSTVMLVSGNFYITSSASQTGLEIEILIDGVVYQPASQGGLDVTGPVTSYANPFTAFITNVPAGTHTFSVTVANPQASGTMTLLQKSYLYYISS